MATFEININIEDYLTEEEKKELVIDVFRNHVRKELFKERDGTIQSDSEVTRVIGNIAHDIVMDEVQKYIPDCKEMIRQKTVEALSKDSFSYYVFKRKDAWDKDEGLAVTYMNQAISECKSVFQERIKKTIADYDLTNDISREISEQFGQMADTVYKLSELFQNKSK